MYALRAIVRPSDCAEGAVVVDVSLRPPIRAVLLAVYVRRGGNAERQPGRNV